MKAWDAAMKGHATPALTIGANQTKPGTVDALVVAYFASSQFLSLSPSTRATYRGIIERFRKENGQRRIAHLQRDKLREMLGNRVKTPAAANNWLRMVRMLMRFAIELGMRNDDPTLGIRTIKVRSEGFQGWAPEHVEKYRAPRDRNEGAIGVRAIVEHGTAPQRRGANGSTARAGRHPFHSAAEDGHARGDPDLA